MSKIASEKNFNKYYNCLPKSMYIMDILSTIIIQQHYKNYDIKEKKFFEKIIPKSNEERVKYLSGCNMSKHLLDFYQLKNINPENDIMNEFYYSDKVINQKFEDNKRTVNKKFREPVKIMLHDSFIKDNLPVYRNNKTKQHKYTSKDIYNMITKLSKTKILLNYRVSFYEYGKYNNYIFKNDNYKSRLFTIKEIFEDLDSTGRVINRMYMIEFNTILGQLFVQNLLSSNMYILDAKFYQMKYKTQQLYRRMILPFFKNKKTNINPNIPLYLKDIKTLLNFTSNNSLSKNYIKPLFDELIENKFIKNLVVEKDKIKGWKYTFDKI